MSQSPSAGCGASAPGSEASGPGSEGAEQGATVLSDLEQKVKADMKSSGFKRSNILVHSTTTTTNAKKSTMNKILKFYRKTGLAVAACGAVLGLR